MAFDYRISGFFRLFSKEKLEICVHSVHIRNISNWPSDQPRAFLEDPKLTPTKCPVSSAANSAIDSIPLIRCNCTRRNASITLSDKNQTSKTNPMSKQQQNPRRSPRNSDPKQCPCPGATAMVGIFDDFMQYSCRLAHNRVCYVCGQEFPEETIEKHEKRCFEGVSVFIRKYIEHVWSCQSFYLNLSSHLANFKICSTHFTNPPSTTSAPH